VRLCTAFSALGAVLLAGSLALASGCAKQEDVVVKSGADKKLGPEQIDADPLALLPSGAVGVGYIDTQKLLTSAFGEKLLLMLQKQMPIPQGAGYEPRRDLAKLYVGFYSMTGADIAGVAIGNFDAANIDAAATATATTALGMPVTKSSYAGRNLFTAQNLGFTVLTQKTALFGNDTGIRRALDRIEEGRARRQLPENMLKLLVEPSAPLVIGGDLTGHPIPNALRSELAFLEGVKTLSIVGNFDPPGLNLAGTFSYADPDSAVRGMQQLLNLRATLDRYAPFLAIVGIPNPIRALSATPNGNDGSFVLAADGQAVAVLLEKAVDFAGAMQKAKAQGGQ
jgi:hypothetical protein